jgi:hypothetical protein
MSDFKIQLNSYPAFETFFKSLDEKGQIELKRSIVAEFAKIHLEKFLDSDIRLVLEDYRTALDNRMKIELTKEIGQLKETGVFSPKALIFTEEFDKAVQVKIRGLLDGYVRNAVADLEKRLVEFDQKVDSIISKKVDAYLEGDFQARVTAEVSKRLNAIQEALIDGVKDGKSSN